MITYIKDQKRRQEIAEQVLIQNSLSYFELNEEFELKEFVPDDKRYARKFYLRDKKTNQNSNKMDYNEMNAFIMGLIFTR